LRYRGFSASGPPGAGESPGDQLRTAALPCRNPIDRCRRSRVRTLAMARTPEEPTRTAKCLAILVVMLARAGSVTEAGSRSAEQVRPRAAADGHAAPVRTSPGVTGGS